MLSELNKSFKLIRQKKNAVITNLENIFFTVHLYILSCRLPKTVEHGAINAKIRCSIYTKFMEW